MRYLVGLLTSLAMLDHLMREEKLNLVYRREHLIKTDEFNDETEQKTKRVLSAVKNRRLEVLEQYSEPKRPHSSASRCNNALITTTTTTRLKGRVTLVARQSLVPDLGPWFSFYKLLMHYYSYVIIIKYGILILIELPIFKSFRWIDCYIPGRSGAVSGRFADAINVFVWATALSASIWRFMVHNIKPTVNLNCLEFLCHSYKQVLAEETRDFCKSEDEEWQFEHEIHRKCSQLWPFVNETLFNNNNQRNPTLVSLKQFKSKRIKQTGTVVKLERNANEITLSSEEYNSIFYLKGAKIAGQNEEFIFRKNRDTKAWLILSTALFYSTIFLISSLISCLIWGLTISVPMLITDYGFELTHFQCVNWIKDQPSELWPSYSHIYDVGKQTNISDILSSFTVRRAKFVLLPLVNIRPFNWYTFINLTIAAVDNLYLISLSPFFISLIIVSFMITLDLIIYSRMIKQLLVRLTLSLDLMQAMRSNINDFSEQSPTIDFGALRSAAKKTLTTVQKMLVDYFGLINDYNG